MKKKLYSKFKWEHLINVGTKEYPDIQNRKLVNFKGLSRSQAQIK